MISALGSGQPTGRGGKYVPYRESKLTKLLMDSLGGSSKALMITFAPSPDSVTAAALTLLDRTRPRSRCLVRQVRLVGRVVPRADWVGTRVRPAGPEHPEHSGRPGGLLAGGCHPSCVRSPSAPCSGRVMGRVPGRFPKGFYSCRTLAQSCSVRPPHPIRSTHTRRWCGSCGRISAVASGSARPTSSCCTR